MKRIVNAAEVIKDELICLSKEIYENPELSNEEHFACKSHIDLLKKHNFVVEENFMGLPTAFKATHDSGKDGATIAYFAEYDALPGVGHGCGHNILGAVSTGAGIALSKAIDEVGGKVLVFGCPAEETSGAKVLMADGGAFHEVDVTLVAHPENRYCQSGKSLAMEALRFEYFGKSAHAATSPELGINALDGVIGLFNNINALRQHIRSDARIHGIIKDGGVAANVVPDYACADFYARATTKEYLMSLVEKLKQCGQASALANGANVKISNYEATYYNLITNETLSGIFSQKLQDMGCKKIHESRKSFGSLDMGNVSHVCPSIHPYFDICGDEKTAAHTKEFADFSVTPYANEQMILTVKALALTGYEVICNKELLKKIKEEFQEATKSST